MMLFLLSFCLTGKVPGAYGETFSREATHMKTRVEVILRGPEKTELEKAAAVAFRIMETVEQELSAKRNGSQIWEINEAAGKVPVRVDPDLFRLLEKALLFSRLSGGAFDIAVSGLSDLWDFRAENFHPPSPRKVRNRLERVDYRKIRLDPATRTVFLHEKGMKISLGGIGKGYAVDLAVKAIRACGVQNGIVSAGGDLTAFGTKTGGDLWTVAVRNPRDSRKVICVIPLSNVSVATSGDYERYRIVE